MKMLNAQTEILCFERRKKVRTEPDGWIKSDRWAHSWSREMHGFHLVVYRPSSCSSYWYKWFNGVSQGRCRTLTACKAEMEAMVHTREAHTFADLIFRGSLWDVVK